MNSIREKDQSILLPPPIFPLIWATSIFSESPILNILHCLSFGHHHNPSILQQDITLMSVYYRKVPNFEVPETKTKKGLDIRVTLHLKNIRILTSFLTWLGFPWIWLDFRILNGLMMISHNVDLCDMSPLKCGNSLKSCSQNHL